MEAQPPACWARPREGAVDVSGGIPPPPPYQDALRGYGCVPLTHCEQVAPLDSAGSCGICPNEAAVGSGAIVSAAAES